MQYLFSVRSAHLLCWEKLGEEIWMLYNHYRPSQSSSCLLNGSTTKTTSCSLAVAHGGTSFASIQSINLQHDTAHWISFRFELWSVANVATMFSILLVPATICCWSQLQFWETRFRLAWPVCQSLCTVCQSLCTVMPRVCQFCSYLARWGFPCFLAKLSLFWYSYRRYTS